MFQSRNNPHKPGLFLAFFVSVFLASGAAFANDSAAPLKNERKVPGIGESIARADRAEKITPGLAGSFLSSRFARHHQDLSEAAKYLNETLARDPGNVGLMHEALRMSLLSGDTKGAVALAKRLEKDANRDPLIATLLMIEQVEKGDFAKARSYVDNTVQSGLYGVIHPVIAAWLEIGSGRVVGKADLQPAIEASGFFAPFLTYHMALMNDVLGNDGLARDAYTKASADPAITPYRVVEAYANFHARQGEWKEAQALFDGYAQANPDSTLLPDKLVPTNSEVRPLVANAKEGLAELFFTTASILFGEESSQETFLYLRVALALKPNLPPAQLMLANMYEQIEDHTQAIATYDSIAPGSVFYRRGQIRKALNYEAMGKKKTALRLLDTVGEAYPNDNTALITKGDMLRDALQYEEAAGAYTDAIARAEPLKQTDWPLLYARGISFERAGEWGKAEADFLRALKLEPNQPDVLNYLSYSWLVMNKNVAQAREYLEIAASARPEDAHIVDSLGWAHYLAGDYHSAVAELERAAEMMPDDPTVNEHLGDAYWRVDRQIEARFQWQRALNFKPDTATEEIIRGKLENGLTPFQTEDKGENAFVPTAPFAAQVP